MTAKTYTDAQIEVVAAKLADGISIEHGRPSPLKMGADMLRSLLSERQSAMQGQGGEFPEDSLAQQLKHAKTDAWAWQMTAKGFNPTKSPKWFVLTGMNLQENPILVFTDRGFAEQFCAHNPSEHGYEIYAAIDACQPPQPVWRVSDDDVLTIEQVREGIVGFVKECARRSIREPIQEANCKNLAGTFESWIKAIDHHFAQSHGVAGAVKSDEADSGRVWNSAVIREVIGELRLEAPKRPSAHYLADKLESAAATQEKQS